MVKTKLSPRSDSIFLRQLNPIHETSQFETWRKNHAWAVLFWCCVTVLVKDWHWRSFLGMGHTNWLLPLVFTEKYFCSVFLWKNGSLGDFYSLLVLDWSCCRLETVKGIAYGEDHGLELCGGTFSQVWLEKPRLAVVQRLGYIV